MAKSPNSDQYSEAEARKRFEAALKGADKVAKKKKSAKAPKKP